MTYLDDFVKTTRSFISRHPGIFDGIRLFCAGLLIESSRRLSTLLYTRMQRALTLTIRIKNNDEAYDWIHHFLSINALSPDPSQVVDTRLVQRSQRFSIFSALVESIWPSGNIPPRDVQLATRKPRYNRFMEDSDVSSFEGTKDPYVKQIKMSLTPYYGVSQAVKFEGRLMWFTVTHAEKAFDNDDEWIEISSFAAPYSLIESFTNHARRIYMARDAGKLAIYLPRVDGRHWGGSWKRAATRPSRPWDSVILPPKTKEGLLEDCQEYLRSADFYRKRGLPYRRGYLLWGKPGSGKSSLIAALAAKLRLYIYMVNLGAKGLDDERLQGLLGECPARCIFLIEDVDCALPTRAKEGSEGTAAENADPPHGHKKNARNTKSEVTLSGLLNALDGVASSEGRLLFCTTNYIELIDHALSRPGRCDVWLQFGYSTAQQAEEVFIQFYPIDKRPEDNQQEGTIGNRGFAGDQEDSKFTGVSIDTLNLRKLAKEFAEKLPQDTVTVSVIQGYLMRYKRRPQAAVDGLEEWAKSGFRQETVEPPSPITGSTEA